MDEDAREAARLVMSALFVAAAIVASRDDATTIDVAIATASTLLDRITKDQIRQPGAR